MNNSDEPSTMMQSLSEAWTTVRFHTPLRLIQNDADYQRVHALADNLADEVGDDETHPLFSLFEVAMDLMQRWEQEHLKIPKANPEEILRYLLNENGMEPKDLANIASPGLISDILMGRRKISRTLARNLGARFHLKPGIFFDRRQLKT